jgi:glycine/sarcosine N-methyltransferase
MTPAVQQCDAGLADEYHLMFADWRAEVVRPGEMLALLIRHQVGPSASSVCDCACGIARGRIERHELTP